MTEEQKLEELKQQRSSTKGSITRIKTLVDTKASSLSSTELECRLGILESYFKQGLAYQTQIERLLPSDNGRAEIEELYINTKTKILTLMPEKRRGSINEATFSMPPPTSRLPFPKLPKFSGNYSEYKNFINSFNQLVQNESSLTNIEKFNHLLSCLSDQALGTVRAFQVTDENYPKALARLKERYDNDCLIFLENIASLLDLPRVSKASSSQLRNLVDNISALFSSLKSIGTESDICNAIIIHIAMSKVDADTHAKWEESLDYTKLPKWDDCATMLSRRCQYLEASDSKLHRFDKNPRYPQKSKCESLNLRSHTSMTVTQRECAFCKGRTHSINNCLSFSKLTVMDRFANAKKLGLCLNCLTKGHGVSKCPSHYRCKTCKLSHHTLLHRTQPDQPSVSSEAVASTSSGTSPSVSSDSNQYASSHSASDFNRSSSTDQVILATALILVQDSLGCFHLGRALLDSGSQVNFITEKFARCLNLHKHKKRVDISGIGVSQTKINFETQTTIRSRYNNFEVSLDFLVSSIITGYQPDKVLSTNNWNIPKNINLADEDFNKPSPIDILLGAEAFFDLLAVGQIKLGQELPILQKTSLGWIVSGKYKTDRIQPIVRCLLSQDEALTEYVERFWELEEVKGKKSKWSEEQLQCEEAFKETIEVLPTGRLMVKLPFKKDPKLLGSSYGIAFRRFLQLECRLLKNLDQKEEYIKFMREYEALGHMTVVESPRLEEPHYYLPHHCVLKPTSLTTKLRVVFNASSNTSSHVSLNDILMTGPTIQNDLFITLLRFRLHKFGLTADIVKMYRQVLVHPLDRAFQYILWRDDPQQPVKTYELNTVTYGTSSAPFQAIRSLRYVAENVKGYQIGAQIIQSDFYVDDLITGADDKQTLLQIKEEVTAVLATAGFELSKWHSNTSQLLSENNTSNKDLNMHESNLTSTLGITWNSTRDTFQFSYNPSKTYSKFTKRSILSLSSSLFDPMGLLSPIIIKAKVILQKLWIEKLDWDASIPQSIDIEWRQFMVDLNSVQNLSVPRHVLSDNKDTIQVHGFCDASMEAYGCCIYLRTKSKRGDITTKLLTSKSRVAPTKRKQLPRLELCGAHLLAKLWLKIRDIFKSTPIEVFFWTDAEIVLYWIKMHSSKLNTFVGNRVAEIQEITPEVNWRHVPTQDNPADKVSRGCTVQELEKSIWFSGPKFLKTAMKDWPQNSCNELSLEERILEVRKTALVCHAHTPNTLLEAMEKFSSYTKTLHVFAYILRFADRATKTLGELSRQEIERSLLRIIWMIQQHHFAEETRSIRRNETPKGAIKVLCPFLDKVDGFELLKVGGRLQNATIPEERKHPLLLPKDNWFVKCLVRHLHVSNFHAGPKALLAFIRIRFWIINARQIAKSIVRNCVHCVKYRPKLLTQLMGDLPAARVTVSRPFSSCGVDFCGPIFTYYKIRGKVPYKTYVAIFVCFASKAVHIEAVSDLSSDAFLAALKRMIGRRGLPKDIYCDNATNFVGAQTKLRELHKLFFDPKTQACINRFCIDNNINFLFTPPRAPHFGGIWESAVKTAKGHLNRSLANAKLNFEELSTALVEIEAIMNSRLLTPLSSDPNDLEALTPGHLLIGASLKAIPERLDLAPNISFLQRWRRINAVKSHFWHRWVNEYVNELQGRTKWNDESANLHVGAMVIVHEDNVPPQKWLLGRVTQVIPGQDGRIRVADIRTMKGQIRRPIRKLALLPA